METLHQSTFLPGDDLMFNTTSVLETTTEIPRSLNTSNLTAVFSDDDTGNDPGPTDIWTPAFTFVYTYGLGFCLFVGTLANLLSLIVMLGKEHRSSSTTAYLIALAVADTLLLWANKHKQWFLYVLGRSLVDTPCNIFVSLLATSTVWSSWCVVCVTVERFIAVRFPFKAASINRPIRARIIMIILPLVIFLIIGLPNLLKYRQEGEKCLVNEGFEFFALYVNAVYWALLRTVLPSAIICSLNLAIVTKLHRSKDSLGEGIASTNQSKARDQDVRRITVTVLTVSTAHLVLTLPISIFLIVMDRRGNNTIDLFSYGPAMALVRIILETLSYLNHAINFFLYVVSSTKFRRELVKLFTCARKKE